MSYNGKENYSLPPRNHTDVNTYHHDKNYELYKAGGALSVLFNTDVIPADEELISDSFSVAFTPSAQVTLKDKSESLFIGTLFLIITAPKIAISQGIP